MTQCPMCSGPTAEEFVERKFEHSVGGKIVTLQCWAPRTECKKCDMFFHDHRMEDAQHKAIDAYLLSHP